MPSKRLSSRIVPIVSAALAVVVGLVALVVSGDSADSRSTSSGPTGPVALGVANGYRFTLSPEEDGTAGRVCLFVSSDVVDNAHVNRLGLCGLPGDILREGLKFTRQIEGQDTLTVWGLAEEGTAVVRSDSGVAPVNDRAFVIDVPASSKSLRLETPNLAARTLKIGE